MKKGVANQASTKIRKNDQKQVDSLIKQLKPKVYITDSSSFKRLVQELTGNGNSSSCGSSSVSIQRHLTAPPKNKLHPQVPDLEVEDVRELESSGVFSFESLKLGVANTFSPDSVFIDLEDSWMDRNKVDDVLPGQELDSYDPFAFLNGYAFQSEKELCISDYDLSELFNTL